MARVPVPHSLVSCFRNASEQKKERIERCTTFLYDKLSRFSALFQRVYGRSAQSIQLLRPTESACGVSKTLIQVSLQAAASNGGVCC